MPLVECEKLRDNPVISASYLVDWFGREMPGNTVLVCVEYAGSGK
jgi:hypothetical protein